MALDMFEVKINLVPEYPDMVTQTYQLSEELEELKYDIETANKKETIANKPIIKYLDLQNK